MGRHDMEAKRRGREKGEGKAPEIAAVVERVVREKKWAEDKKLKTGKKKVRPYNVVTSVPFVCFFCGQRPL